MAKSAATSPSLAGRIVATVFFAIFLTVGLLVFGAITAALLPPLKTYRWKAVPATIDQSRVLEPVTGKPRLRVYVQYHYTYDGQRYTSRNYTLDREEAEVDHPYQVVERLRPGSEQTCYVNPAKPSQALLDRPAPWMGFLALIPVVFIAVGLFGIIAVWKMKPNRPVSQKPISKAASGQKVGPLFIFGFFGIFFLIGGLLTYIFGVRPLQKVRSAQNWISTPCEIVTSRVSRHRSSDSTTYAVDIVYRYQFNGRTITADRYNFASGTYSSGYQGKADVVANYPPGSRTTCFVNPDDPGDAVLNREYDGLMLLGFIPLLFFVVGAVGLFWGLKSRIAPKAGPLGTDDLFRTTSNTSFQSPSGSAAPAGTSTLKPSSSRRTKVFVMAGVALFWNGIVSIFVYHVVSAWIHGHGSVFETLFMTPFVLIGLGLIAAVVRFALALFNPEVALHLDRPSPHLGQTLEIRWDLTGRGDRLKSLKLVLEGQEEATYRRGTDTSTDRSVFATFEIFSTDDPVRMRGGQAKVTIPEQTMHSFKSSNNKIVWTLKLRGEIPKWPDIEDDYSLTVLPKPLPQ